MPRLLLCKNKACQTLEELPIYTGPPEQEADDPLLNNLVKRHLERHGAMADDEAALLVVADEDWADSAKRDGILKELTHRNTGFSPEIYAVKNTFQEDALRCYSAHSRPKDGCIDYCDHSKMLTTSAWKAEGEELVDSSDAKLFKDHLKENKDPANDVYLCHFCPVQSYVNTEVRFKKGLYK